MLEVEREPGKASRDLLELGRELLGRRSTRSPGRAGSGMSADRLGQAAEPAPELRAVGEGVLERLEIATEQLERGAITPAHAVGLGAPGFGPELEYCEQAVRGGARVRHAPRE